MADEQKTNKPEKETGTGGNQLYGALTAPLGDIISSVARGVAEAQSAIDLHTIESFKKMYETKGDGDELLSDMQKLGFQPTWYRIPEVNAEISMTLTIHEDANINGKSKIQGLDSNRGLRLSATPLDANYTNTYNYDIRGSSKLTFRIVPVPPTPRAEQMQVVPNITDTPLADARYLLDSLNIGFESEGGKKGNHVVSTAPVAGSILKLGQKLTLKLEARMPDLIGKTGLDAKVELEFLGITHEIKDQDLKKNVKSTTPEKGTVLDEDQTVTINF